MKRKLLWAFAALLSVGALTSCEDDSHTLRDEMSEDIDWYSKKITVKSDDWVLHSNRDNDNIYYYADIKVSELTGSICKGGIICCYLYEDNAQTQLPCTRYYQDSDQNYWSKTIDYDFYKGGITIYVTDSEFYDENPGDMEFRLAFIY